jgi:hypothetical protein
MKDHVIAFCFSYITLCIAFVVAFCVSKLGGITDFNVFVITVSIVWFLEFVAAFWMNDTAIVICFIAILIAFVLVA